MAWTAFPTWVSGQVSLAADWNTYVAANLNFLAQLPTILCAPTAQSVISAGTAAAISSMALVLQQGGYTSFASSGVITVGVTGVWLVNYQITWQSGGGGLGAAGNYQAQVYHNGGGVIFTTSEYSPAFYNTSPGNSIPVNCSVNDTLQLYGYNGGSGGEGTGYLNVPSAGYNTWLGLILVSGTTATG